MQKREATKVYMLHRVCIIENIKHIRLLRVHGKHMELDTPREAERRWRTRISELNTKS